MATKFPKFSQDRSRPDDSDLYGIATGNDFESHDGMRRGLPKIFATHRSCGNHLPGPPASCSTAWQGNFQQWIKDPLNVRPIAHAIWDPQFGKAVDVSRKVAQASTLLTLVYHWWYTIGMRTNNDLYTGVCSCCCWRRYSCSPVGCICSPVQS